MRSLQTLLLTDMEKFIRVKREKVYEGVKLNFCRDTLITPDGKEVFFDHIEHPGAAAVLPVTDEGKIIMVTQFRNAVDRFTLEIPAGGCEKGEDPLVTAKRELEEEAGVKSDDLEYLISVNTEIAFCDEQIEVYVAHNLKPSHQNLDPDEFINVSEWDIDDLIEKIYSGEIKDCKTSAALLAYKMKYCK